VSENANDGKENRTERNSRRLFKNGLNKEKEAFGKGTPIVNYMDVLKSTEITADRLKGRVMLSPNEIKRHEVKKGDVFFTRTSETINEIGLSSVVVEDLEDTVFSGFILRARPKNKRLDTFFTKYCFSTFSSRKEIVRKSTYTTRALTNGSFLSEVILLVPPVKEQKAIATLLGLVDETISNVRETIEQKQLQKRYLTQALLTGNKRLKGFKRSKWRTFRFRELATESTARNNGKMSNDRLMAVSKFHGLIPMRERVQGVSNSRCKTVAKDYFAYNPMRLNIGSLARWENEEPAMVSGDYVVFKCIEDRLDPNFFDFYRETNEWANYVRRAGDGSVRVRIYFSHLCPLKLKLPPLDEQRAIAKIIGLADWEITLLKTKTEFLQLKKRWLMQVLLTGKERLKVEDS
jgi:type I restriction enzyme, S subunit